jgi:hypothetical protein
MPNEDRRPDSDTTRAKAAPLVVLPPSMHVWGVAAAVFVTLLACNGAAPAPSPAPSGAASPESPPSAQASSASLPPASAPTVAPPLSARRAASLAQDVADRTALVHVSTPRVRTVGEAAVSVVQRTVDALYAGPFAHRPDKSVVVWVYSSQRPFERETAFLRIPRNEPPGLGLYDPTRRVIFTWTDGAGLGSISHEIAHPLEIADFPRAPAWVLEGIPSLFESVDLSHPGEIRPKAHFRLQTLRDTLASKDADLAASIRLDALFAMVDDASFREAPVYLHYAISREALRWLSDTGKLWPWYRDFRDHALEDPRGIDAFTRIVGKSPADATADWLAWIHSDAAEGAAP